MHRGGQRQPQKMGCHAQGLRGSGGARDHVGTGTAISLQMVQSLGFAIYRALDWGLDENEERELSPQLEQLIDLMTNSDSEDSGCGTADEGYGGQEEEEEGGEGPPRAVRTFGQAMRCCAARLADPAEAQAHYQAVCRALFAETVELKAFLAKIRDAKEVSGGREPPPKCWGERGALRTEPGRCRCCRAWGCAKLGAACRAPLVLGAVAR